MSNLNPVVVVVVVTGLAGRCLLRTSQHGAKTLAENSSVFRGESPQECWDLTDSRHELKVAVLSQHCTQQAVFISSVGE